MGARLGLSRGGVVQRCVSAGQVLHVYNFVCARIYSHASVCLHVWRHGVSRMWPVSAKARDSLRAAVCDLGDPSRRAAPARVVGVGSDGSWCARGIREGAYGLGPSDVACEGDWRGPRRREHVASSVDGVGCAEGRESKRAHSSARRGGNEFLIGVARMESAVGHGCRVCTSSHAHVSEGLRETERRLHSHHKRVNK